MELNGRREKLMVCTTTREERAERGSTRNVLIATILAISTVSFFCVTAATAQVATPVVKPTTKKQARPPAKAVEPSMADQLNAKWLADYSTNQDSPAPTANTASSTTTPAPAANIPTPAPVPTATITPTPGAVPTATITPTPAPATTAGAGEEDRFWSLSTGSSAPPPVANGSRAVVQGSVAIVKASSTAVIATVPGGSSLTSYKEVVQAFAGFASNGVKVEIAKGQTADGSTRLLFASIGEGKSKLSFWWFAPPDQPEGWFDDSGHRLGGTLLAAPKPDSRISSPFGTRRYYGRSSGHAFHNGIDFEGKVGEPIYAAADGVINHMGFYYNYGRTVKISHADSFETLYAHMSRFPPGMGPGTFVHKGDLIGYVGSTGRSTGPHLHFSTIVNGQFVDPEPYLSQQGDGQLNAEALVAFRQWQQDVRLAADPKKAGTFAAVRAPQPQPAAPDSWSQSPFAPKGNSLLGHL
jgi:murein DD-endopeptidase MepM/ murein hydrolase activator NlpD